MQTETSEDPGLHPAAHTVGGVTEEAVRAAAAGRSGWTVRCTPERRTVYVPAGTGRAAFFVKLRSGGSRRRAAHERGMLRHLWEAGFPVPELVAAPHRIGGDTVVVMGGVPGRPVQSLLAEKMRPEERGGWTLVANFLTQCAAPRLAKLHGLGFVYRDMYWNHWLAPALDAPEAQISWIDVERVFRPRVRMLRWVVKDLAGLWSSRPGVGEASRREVGLGMRFLRSYLAARAGAGHPLAVPPRELARLVAAKGARIRSHRPLHP